LWCRVWATVKSPNAVTNILIDYVDTFTVHTTLEFFSDNSQFKPSRSHYVTTPEKIVWKSHFCHNNLTCTVSAYKTERDDNGVLWDCLAASTF
jgi:hypothetical protein